MNAWEWSRKSHINISLINIWSHISKTRESKLGISAFPERRWKPWNSKTLVCCRVTLCTLPRGPAIPWLAGYPHRSIPGLSCPPSVRVKCVYDCLSFDVFSLLLFLIFSFLQMFSHISYILNYKISAPSSITLRGGSAVWGFPGDKESTCQCRRCKRWGFDPWIRKSCWWRRWQLTPLFLPGKSRQQRSLVGNSPWGHKNSDMTEHPCTYTHTTL